MTPKIALLTAKLAMLRLLTGRFGAVFWWLEQAKSRTKDRLDLEKFNRRQREP